MKLLSTAALIWLAVDWRLADQSSRGCFFAVRAVALPTALLSIPVLFYFLKGAFGIENVVVDIGLFLIAAILYQGLAMTLEKRWDAFAGGNAAGVIVLAAIFLIFVLFTFWPPHLPLFLDVRKGIYGIAG